MCDPPLSAAIVSGPVGAAMLSLEHLRGVSDRISRNPSDAEAVTVSKRTVLRVQSLAMAVVGAESSHQAMQAESELEALLERAPELVELACNAYSSSNWEHRWLMLVVQALAATANPQAASDILAAFLVGTPVKRLHLEAICLTLHLLPLL